MMGTLVSSLNRWNEGSFVPSRNSMVQSFLWVEAGAVCRCAVFFSALFQCVLRYWGSQQQEAQERSWVVYKVPAEK